uniref:Uncharacterized protein n=1 Tax=Setaria italica TaxID=4555 RepID=K3Y1F1_SETIT
MSSLATESLLTHTSSQVPWDSRRLGKDLDRISRGLHTKLPIHVREGLKWLEVPMQATKFASEGGIILCGYIPILTRWKDYKTDNEKHLKNYISKLTRQGRYWLKKKLFNDLPANVVPTKSPMTTLNDDQWNNMVTMWSSPPHRV